MDVVKIKCLTLQVLFYLRTFGSRAWLVSLVNGPTNRTNNMDTEEHNGVDNIVHTENSNIETENMDTDENVKLRCLVRLITIVLLEEIF